MKRSQPRARYASANGKLTHKRSAAAENWLRRAAMPFRTSLARVQIQAVEGRNHVDEAGNEKASGKYKFSSAPSGSEYLATNMPGT